MAKINSKKVYEKMKNNSTLEKVLLVCNKNAELLRLVGATFNFNTDSLRRMWQKNFINSEKFAEEKFTILLSLLTFELSNIN